MADLGKCRSCGAAILWVTMEPSGKKNPLDAEPSPNGNIVASEGGKGMVVKGDQLLQLREAGSPLYLSHFASCSGAAQHRKPR